MPQLVRLVAAAKRNFRQSRTICSTTMGHNPVAIATIVQSSTNHKKLPELSTSFSSESNHRHSRHSPTISQYFDASETGEEEDSPSHSALDSTAALILVHDDDDEEEWPLPFADDDDEREYDDELVSPMFDLRRSAVFPPLRPSLVFLYLLASHLRLGALNIPYTPIPLKYALPALLLSAAATAFTRQIWYMLARYIRKASVSDVFMDTFARGRGNERRRLAIRSVVKTCIGSLGVFLSIVFLRYSMYTLYPIFAEGDHPGLFYSSTGLLVFIVVAYLSYARSLNHRRIIYATGLSLAAYIAWLGCIIYAYSKGLLQPKGGWLGSGDVWPGLVTIVFAFCSSSTLPLYASLKSSSHPASGSKLPVSWSFRFLSSSSAILAVLLLLPSVIFAAFPNYPAPSSNSTQNPLSSIPTHHGNTRGLDAITGLNVTAVPILDRHRPPPPTIPLPTFQIHTISRILSATTLILSIPSILVSIPPLRIPSLRSVKFNISRVIIILFVMICGLIPPSRFPQPDDPTKSRNNGDLFLNSSGIFAFIVLITLFMAYMGTYFIPTFLHISQHFFKRPLAIVVPRARPSQEGDESGAGPSTSHLSPSSSPRFHDELLLRKERALQKKQFKKRIAWDIGVWMLLLTSLAGLIGYGGYLAQAW